MQPQLGNWKRFIRSLSGEYRCSLSWWSRRGLLEVYEVGGKGWRCQIPVCNSDLHVQCKSLLQEYKIAEPPVSLILTAPYKCPRHYKVWWCRVSYRRWSESPVTDNFAIGSSLTYTLQETVTVQDLLLQVYLGEDEDEWPFNDSGNSPRSHYWHSGVPGSVQQPHTNCMILFYVNVPSTQSRSLIFSWKSMELLWHSVHICKQHQTINPYLVDIITVL